MPFNIYGTYGAQQVKQNTVVSSARNYELKNCIRVACGGIKVKKDAESTVTLSGRNELIGIDPSRSTKLS